MKAAVVQSFTAPPLYTTFDDPVPNPSAGEVLVNVTAAALHRIVKSLANGTHYGTTGILPFVPGVDGVGRLQASFGQLPAGTRVLFGSARPPFGTFAEQSLANASMLIPVPDALPDATAAAIANPAMSSAVALMRAQFQPGESVLILGATGVSGQLAVQIAKSRGAHRVIAIGRNPQALAELTSLGADATISLDQSPEALTAALRNELASGVDIVLDYLWGPPAETLLAAIAQKGLSHAAPRIRYVQIGNMAGPNISLPAATLRSSGLELLGSGFGSASLDQIRQAILAFFAQIATNPLQFALKTAPLSEVTTLWNTGDHGVRLVFQP
ncbi:MAG TPA: zinc-binding alcohol dehydrogenase family protein [Acidobacteriaceae bacterium]|nr:zinc-binding alcohol dehydrogenase family protein [Acidobacteriaceae bacterium]